MTAKHPKFRVCLSTDSPSEALALRRGLLQLVNVRFEGFDIAGHIVIGALSNLNMHLLEANLVDEDQILQVDEAIKEATE